MQKIRSKRKFYDRWADVVFTLPELYNQYISENVGFTFPQWLDLQMEWNGGRLEEVRINTTISKTTKSLATLKKEYLRLFSDFNVVLSPELRQNVNAARNEFELDCIRRKIIAEYI